MANKELKAILVTSTLSATKVPIKFKGYDDRKMNERKKHLLALNAIKNKMLLRVAAIINQQKNMRPNIW